MGLTDKQRKDIRKMRCLHKKGHVSKSELRIFIASCVGLYRYYWE